jgi:hypothetical protein
MSTVLVGSDTRNLIYTYGKRSIGRAILFDTIDSLVELYNVGDFESLVSKLAVMCCEDVVPLTCLEAPTSTNNRKSLSVLTSDDRITPYIAQHKTRSSIAFTWMLLQKSHPDGTMTIIDRRICYRPWEQPSKIPTNNKSTSANSASVMEVVVMLCGTCVAQHSLQQLVQQKESEQKDSKGRTHRSDPSAGQPGPVGHDSNSCGSRVVGVGARVVPERLAMNTAVISQVIDNLIRSTPPQCTRTNNSCTVGKRWRYLIEFRLQFDEHDLVTHWTTTMLAAEPEEILTA